MFLRLVRLCDSYNIERCQRCQRGVNETWNRTRISRSEDNLEDLQSTVQHPAGVTWSSGAVLDVHCSPHTSSPGRLSEYPELFLIVIVVKVIWESICWGRPHSHGSSKTAAWWRKRGEWMVDFMCYVVLTRRMWAEICISLGQSHHTIYGGNFLFNAAFGASCNVNLEDCDEFLVWYHDHAPRLKSIFTFAGIRPLIFLVGRLFPLTRKNELWCQRAVQISCGVIITSDALGII